MDELATALAQVEMDPAVCAVIFSGSGKSFSTGVDVAAHTAEQVPLMLEKFHRIIRALVTSKKVTIASVHGQCLGGAAELAMMCDLVYTTDDAQWGFPEIRLGCFPPVAASALSALVGQKCATELILTGRTISGSEAARMGIANRAVPADELSRVVEDAAGTLGALSPATLAIARKAIYTWDFVHFDKGLARAEKLYMDELMKTEDATEAIQAFIQKRAPRWKGR